MIRDIETDMHLISITSGTKKTTFMIRTKSFPAETREAVMLKAPITTIQVDTADVVEAARDVATFVASGGQGREGEAA